MALTRFASTRLIRARAALAVTLAAWLLLPLSQANGQVGPVGDPTLGGTRTLTAVPANKSEGVDLKVEVTPRSARLGEIVEICFSSATAGYVTLWNIGAEDQVQRIFPNALEPASAGAMQIAAGQRYCAGKQGDAFRFRVDPPAGTDTLYAVWTVSPDLQPRPASYASAAAYAADLERLRGVGRERWATAKTSFEIVDPARPAGPALPPPASQGGLGLSPPTPPIAAAPPPPIAAPAPPPPIAAPPRQPPSGGATDMSSVFNDTAARPSRPPPPPRPVESGLSERPARPQQAYAPPPPPMDAPPSMLGGEPPRIVLLSMGANVDPLQKTNQDATIVVQTFKQMFNVPDSNIRLIHNVKKAEFKGGIDWMKSRLRPQDLAVVFFSGHGAQVRDPTGTSADGYDEAFVPYDVELKSNPGARDLIWSQEYARWVNALPTNNVITIVDACHSAGLTRSIGSETLGATPKSFSLPATADPTPPDELNQPLTRAAVGAGRIQAKGLLLAAARRDQSALEVSSGGLFIVKLLSGMRQTRNGTLRSVFDATQRDVSGQTRGRQVPEAVGARHLAEQVLIGR